MSAVSHVAGMCDNAAHRASVASVCMASPYSLIAARAM